MPRSPFSEAAPLFRNGSRIFPLGFHSPRAAAFKLSSERLVIVLLASVKIIARSNALHEGMGVGVMEGAPLEVHTGGEEGIVTLVAKNSHVPLKLPPDWKLEAFTVNPFPFKPGAKRVAGIASPVGERKRFSKVYASGTVRASSPVVE